MEPVPVDPEVASSLTRKGAPEIPIQKFQFEGRTVYEWEQTLDEVKVCVWVCV